MKQKVDIAFNMDICYNRARIDIDTREKLNLNIGDIIEITGNSKTVAVVWRSHPNDEGKGIIRIDEFTRENAGVCVGDEVTIKKATTKKAKEITVAPLHNVQLGEDINILLNRNLRKRPVTKGDIVIIPNITSLGQILPFQVMETKPSGNVIIEEETVIKTEKPFIRKEIKVISTGGPKNLETELNKYVQEGYIIHYESLNARPNLYTIIVEK